MSNCSGRRLRGSGQAFSGRTTDLSSRQRTGRGSMPRMCAGRSGRSAGERASGSSGRRASCATPLSPCFRQRDGDRRDQPPRGPQFIERYRDGLSPPDPAGYRHRSRGNGQNLRQRALISCTAAAGLPADLFDVRRDSRVAGCGQIGPDMSHDEVLGGSMQLGVAGYRWSLAASWASSWTSQHAWPVLLRAYICVSAAVP